MIRTSMFFDLKVYDLIYCMF